MQTQEEDHPQGVSRVTTNIGTKAEENIGPSQEENNTTRMTNHAGFVEVRITGNVTVQKGRRELKTKHMAVQTLQLPYQDPWLLRQV